MADAARRTRFDAKLPLLLNPKNGGIPAAQARINELQAVGWELHTLNPQFNLALFVEYAAGRGEDYWPGDPAPPLAALQHVETPTDPIVRPLLESAPTS